MRKFILLACVILPSGCVTDQYTTEKSMCERNPTWVGYAQCLNRIGTIYYANDSTEHEMIAYRNLLIEKVNTNQMTESEAEYLRQKKWSEAKQRLATHQPVTDYHYQPTPSSELPSIRVRTPTAVSAPTSTPMPTMQNSERTECQPDGYGGMRCATYR